MSRPRPRLKLPSRSPASTPWRERIGFWLGLAAFVAIWLFGDLDPGNPLVTVTAAIAALMAIWWMTEPVSLAVTALLPVLLFPLFGVMSGGDVAVAYMDRNLFLFAGGFLLALAMQRWNLHRRIALIVLLLIGGRPHRIVLGFMVAAGLLSMWVSNTATAMMMMPMGLSLALLYEQLNAERAAEGVEPGRRAANFPLVLMLGIAYACSIGGIGTIIGTPPNVVLVSIYHQEFPDAPMISFAQWFIFGAPFAVFFLLLTWALLCWVIYPLPAESPFSGRAWIRGELEKLGRITREETMVMIVFFVTALLWIFRADIQFGEAFTLPGWSSLLETGPLIDDGTVAMAAGLLLFILPASKQRGGGRLMDWETTKSLPWEILILFGGGFALARGFTASGLSDWIGSQFQFLENAPMWAMILSVSTTINLVTEMTSNTATTQMILPILASLARTLDIHPLLLMIPAAMSASCAFMLPVATPPNAVIYGSGKVPIGKMIRAGIFLNALGVLLVLLFVLTLALPIFDIG